MADKWHSSDANMQSHRRQKTQALENMFCTACKGCARLGAKAASARIAQRSQLLSSGVEVRLRPVGARPVRRRVSARRRGVAAQAAVVTGVFLPRESARTDTPADAALCAGGDRCRGEG